MDTRVLTMTLASCKLLTWIRVLISFQETCSLCLASVILAVRIKMSNTSLCFIVVIAASFARDADNT